MQLGDGNIKFEYFKLVGLLIVFKLLNCIAKQLIVDSLIVMMVLYNAILKLFLCKNIERASIFSAFWCKLKICLLVLFIFNLKLEWIHIKWSQQNSLQNFIYDRRKEWGNLRDLLIIHWLLVCLDIEIVFYSDHGPIITS